MVEVTQADRDAAAAYHRAVGSPQKAIDFILSGHSDQDSLVRALSRHRQSETAAMQARIAELEVAASLALANWGKYNSEKSDEVVYQAEKMADVLRSIAALGSAKP